MSPANKLGRKVSRYVSELRLCFQAGADLRSRLSLASDTILFHLDNALSPKRRRRTAQSKRRHLILGAQRIDLMLRTYSGDLFVFHEVFLDGCYHVPATWGRDVRNVVDLGANVGLTTLYLSRAFQQARFICVEPDPNNAAILRHNVSCLGERVQVLEGAISDRAGEALFDSSEHSWGGKLIEQGQESTRTVRCFTMDEIVADCDLDTIDILKVDIEGAEEQLFRGSAEWLGRVKVIIVELHGSYSIERFRQDVQGHGFKVLPPGKEYGNQMIFAVRSDLFEVLT